MRTFDWALFELYNDGLIGYEEAIRNADSANELRLNIKLKSQRGEPSVAAGLSLELHEAPTPEQVEAIRKEELRKQQEKRDELELARMQAAKREAAQPPR
jgi:twitching motility protein PilU